MIFYPLWVPPSADVGVPITPAGSGIRVYMDGARLNVSIDSAKSVEEFDSVIVKVDLE